MQAKEAVTKTRFTLAAFLQAIKQPSVPIKAGLTRSVIGSS
eukprot:CAMPEP_0177357604 /NCGR_PEP_ID=MMETSP0368-20130122/35151_1 /TAXON_ID=447022 ORGANISM="Scrippsiella hangoei-like, Strain SHHI-4" /NCGR_SAMPLE_ID=MMETSP0368 /ASSEMBLY_ACC=CAM_ASM_000363 /LENGTH=40 /DNA_ID= /DNA_START= /DNA_END= /DNA_ORIENTATION=